jgi:hypothetical protein
METEDVQINYDFMLFTMDWIRDHPPYTCNSADYYTSYIKYCSIHACKELSQSDFNNLIYMLTGCRSVQEVIYRKVR